MDPEEQLIELKALEMLNAWMRTNGPFPARPIFEKYLYEWDVDFRQEVLEIIQKIDAESASEDELVGND